MNIRPWREEDIPDITFLLNQLSEDLGEKEIIKEENVYLNFQRMKDPEYYQSFVYLEDSHIVGFISMIFYRK